MAEQVFSSIRVGLPVVPASHHVWCRPIVTERADYDGSVAAVRTHLDDGTWSAAYTEGRTMSLHQAITYALETIALRRHDGAAA